MSALGQKQTLLMHTPMSAFDPKRTLVAPVERKCGASKDYGSKSAMIYHVRAKFREDTAAAFLAKLTDGTIENQRPDGRELVASMKRAVVSDDGLIEWSELCYCDSPLAHERATVLDSHFDEISTEPIDAHESYSGRAFMDYLRTVVRQASYVVPRA
jgi:hypothetical protein